MLTGKDVKTLVKEFATKDDFVDLRQEMKDFKSNMSVEFLSLETRLENKFDEFDIKRQKDHSEILKGLDNINGSILDLKQEKFFTDQGINRLDENDVNQQKEIENHSQQIKRIKKHLKIA